MRDQEESKRGREEEQPEQDDFQRCASLPSFPDSFNMPGCRGMASLGMPIDPCPTQEELDALDLEIEAIVGQRGSGVVRGVESPYTPANILHTPDYPRPQALRTSTVTLSPTGEVSSIQEASLVGQCGGRVSVVEPPLVMVSTVNTVARSQHSPLASEAGLVHGQVELVPVVGGDGWGPPPLGYKRTSQFTGEYRLYTVWFNLTRQLP